MRSKASAGKRTWARWQYAPAFFHGLCIVHCPQCRDAARVDCPDPHAGKGRLSCVHCGYSREKGQFIDSPWGKTQFFTVNADCDPYFGLPLWIRCTFRGKPFWAYNWEHLAVLEDAVGSELRPGGPPGKRSTLNNLPKWMLAASNREAVLRMIRRLRKEKLRSF